MPGAEIYIPDYTDETGPEEYERYERERLEREKPEILTPAQVEIFFQDVPF
jgi:hypothetical protein